MDCNTARTLLTFVQPSGRELVGDEATVLESHLSECTDCAGLAQREQQLDALLMPAMRAVPIPVDLKARILGKLIDPKPLKESRRWIRPLAISVSAAAALLVVGALVLGWSLFHKPAPDVNQLVEDDYYYAPRRADAVEDRFRNEFGVVVVAPTQFDYQFLVTQKLESHRDRKVPVLVFARPIGDRIETAQVYIFSDKDYDVSALSRELPAVSGGCSVQKLPSTNPHFVYLVLFTSERLEDFFPSSPARKDAT